VTARLTLTTVMCALTLVACGTSTPSTEEGSSSSAKNDPRIGRRVHITGCEKGALVVPVVNLWDSPKRTRAVGKLSGDGRADRGLSCQGAVVIIRDVQGELYQVESVIGDQIGWVTEPFIGRTFDTSMCQSFFSESPAAAQKCSQ